ncbi:hypothetical protein BS17DRAFT_359974 [Gyrodon lividus]|nr:hypothetical protein BS17DRAFT_359974 [Gyrodon lividus]
MQSVHPFAIPETGRSGLVKDVLSGKERIISFTAINRHSHRNLTACNLAALNFARVSFKHLQRTRGNAAGFLSAITERHVLEEVISLDEQSPGGHPLQLEEMCRVPLFDTSLTHVATKHGPPSMIQLKQSLRQMQLSPVSALIISRNTSTTTCLKLRENTKDIFLLLDFAPNAERYSPLTLILSTTVEQTAARLSGVLPIDNRLVTRDKQWQAQLFTSCSIHMFTPVRGVVLFPEVESSAITESMALLRVMAEIDGRGRDRVDQLSGSSSSRRELERSPGDTAGAAPRRSHEPSNRTAGVGPPEEEPRTRMPRTIRPMTIVPYEQTKRHCRVFYHDEHLPPSPISLSSEESEEGGYFECLICFEEMLEEDGVNLLPCAHGFCRACLIGHVCSKIEERKYPVFCPLCMADKGNASPSVISGAFVQQLGVTEDQYAIWAELEMAHLSVQIQCRKCHRSAFVDKGDYEQLPALTCPFPGCEHTWCKNCQQSITRRGPKHSCDGSEEFDHLVKQMGWKHCPRCKTPVQKNGGCNHMTCVTPGCNSHFCYRCGKQITRSSIPLLVTSAINGHYRQCTL